MSATPAGEQATAPIEIRALHKSFGDLEVLRGIDAGVARGEVVCVIGPSGSGKSTLLRCINLLEVPTAGEIYVGGVEVTDPDVDIDAIRRRIGMVFQQFNLFPHLTVTENVSIAQRRVLGRGQAEAEQVTAANLERVGLTDKADVYPAQLSGGQQQRAAIARALAMGPELMLFDEPTSALDPEIVGDVLAVNARAGGRRDDDDRRHARDELRARGRRPRRVHGRRCHRRGGGRRAGDRKSR